MRDEISPGLSSAAYWALGSVLLSTLLAFLVSRITLAPLARISKQLDRISAGEFDLEPAVERGDELGAGEHENHRDRKTTCTTCAKSSAPCAKISIR